MANVYKGTFGIKANTNNEVILAPHPEGKYTAADAATVYKRVQAIAKEQKLVARLFKPEASCTEPVILCDKYGKPYLALLKKRTGPAIKRAAPAKWFD
jgi:hypothetical protein